MKINITFTKNEKTAILNLVEACGGNPEKVFGIVEHNDTIDQVHIQDLSNGGILTVDESLTCNIIKFVERKVEPIKMMINFFKGSFKELRDMLNKSITHDKSMKSFSDEVLKKDKDVVMVYTVCTENGKMNAVHIRKNQTFDYVEKENVVEKMLVCQSGYVYRTDDEISNIVNMHNNAVAADSSKDVIDDNVIGYKPLSEKDIQNIRVKMMVRAYEKRRELGEKLGDEMIAAICKYRANNRTGNYSTYAIWENDTCSEVFIPETLYDYRAIFDFGTCEFIDDIDEMNKYIAKHNALVEASC